MNPLRTLAWRIMDRHAPAGTTHVLRHVPSDFLDPPNGVGLWDLWNLRTPYPDGLDAPADLPEEDAAAFVAETLGYPVTLVRSSTDLRLDQPGSEWVTEPVYYVIPR